MYPALALSRIVAIQPVLDAIERDQAAPHPAFDNLPVGQALTGLVKGVSKGITLVDIEGQTVAMRLPQPPAAGDTLRLRFAGHAPQPVFLLENPEGSTGEAPQLSQAARLLSDLVQRLPARPTPPTVTPPGPLLGQPVVHPAELALALRTALVRSGLFYESHLADWAVGQDSLEGLMQEPQNRLAAADAARQAGAALPSAAPHEAAPVAARTAEAAAASLAGATGAAGEGAAAKALTPLHALLAQQLQVLESPQFVWRGEVWPGQALEWQIRQEPEDGHARNPSAPADAGGTGWESQLRLTLPRLGALTVHIRLDANQAFSIRMVPEQPEVAPLLQQNQARLASQLAGAGCSVQSLTVQRDAGA